MSRKVEKEEERVCISYIATIVHTFLQPSLEKRKKKKGKLQFLLGLAGMELAFFMPAYKEKEEEGEKFVVTAFVFPSNRYGCWLPAFQGAAEKLPAGGKQWTNSSAFFAHMCISRFLC